MHPNISDMSDPNGPRPFGDGRSDGEVINSKTQDRFTYQSRNHMNNQDFFNGSNVRQRPKPMDSQMQNRAPGGTNVNYTGNRSHEYMRYRGGGYNNRMGQRDMYFQPNPRFHRGMYNGRNFWRGKVHTGVVTSTYQPTKFTGDYDYEKANAEFISELEKMSISAVIVQI